MILMKWKVKTACSKSICPTFEEKNVEWGK